MRGHIRVRQGTRGTTELAAAGVPMTVVRDRLRHSNIRTTSIYAHGRRALDREAANAIGEALRRPRTAGPNV